MTGGSTAIYNSLKELKLLPLNCLTAQTGGKTGAWWGGTRRKSEERLTGDQSLQGAGSTCYRLRGCSGYRPHPGWPGSYAWWRWRWALMDGHSSAERRLELRGGGRGTWSTRSTTAWPEATCCLHLILQRGKRKSIRERPGCLHNLIEVWWHHMWRSEMPLPATRVYGSSDVKGSWQWWCH